MLNASFETKCFNFSIEILSQLYPSLEHLLTASSFLVIRLKSLIVFDPQDGHCFGKLNSVETIAQELQKVLEKNFQLN